MDSILSRDDLTREQRRDLTATERGADTSPVIRDRDPHTEDGNLTVTETISRPDSVSLGGEVATDRVTKPRLDGPRPSFLVKWLAILGSIIGFTLFIAVPFMPVNQSQTSLSWPQNGGLNSVNAPLVGYSPLDLQFRVPISMARELPDKDDGVLVGTMPPEADKATANGMQVRVRDGVLSVISKNRVLLSLNKAEMKDNAGGVVVIHSTPDETSARVPGGFDEDGEPLGDTVKEDIRPQVTGVYTDVPSDANPASTAFAGLDVQIEIDSRFTSTPTTLKIAVMAGGLVMLVLSLWAMSRIDRVDGARRVRWMRRDWWKPTFLDGIVVLVLAFWHFFGSNTSDDGYILTMARAAHDAGYMANYYRWFGVPESPFGWPYYDLLALMTHVSSTSVWVRLPATIAALAAWFVISRLVIPRLGNGISRRRVAYWSAAGVLLAFWLPYNNGLRPEPVIALATLMTWVCIERAILTRRLLPAACGVIIATLALGSGPTGLMAIAALLTGLPALIRIVIQRHRALGGGLLAPVMQIAPFLPAGTMILVGVFGNQTLATVLEAVRVRGIAGPNSAWYEEPIRWYSLMLQSNDGSLTRRFAVLVALVALGITIAALLRHRTVPGALAAPATRLVFIFLGTMFFMTFTPTKWTHHFGVYAGVAAALAALAAMAVSHWAINSVRNQLLFTGLMIFLLSYCMMSINGWWYVGAYGIPWFDKTPQYDHFEFGNLVLLISLVVLGIGAAFTFVEEYRGHRNPGSIASRLRIGTIAASPIAVATFLVVTFSILSFTKGMVSQYPAYTIGLGNMRSLSGQTCQMAEDVLMETDSTDAVLKPVSGSQADSLAPDDWTQGFSPDGLPPEMLENPASSDNTKTDEDTETPKNGVLSPDESSSDSADSENKATEEEKQADREKSANGSSAKLPFGLDPEKVPVLGSYSPDVQQPAKLMSQWYRLPAETANAPLVVVSAAGNIAHNDINGVDQEGQELILELGKKSGDGYQVIGEITPYDVGPAPVWRNLRFPVDELPDEANYVRIVARDTDLGRDEWIAVTPPRVPELTSLVDVMSGDMPTLPDWPVSLQFPCQRPFDHWGGVAEIPKYRILADHGLTAVGPDMWQDDLGGGPLGWTDAISEEIEIPTYLRNDWKREWGSVIKLDPRTDSEGVTPDTAQIDVEEVTRSGLWYPGPMALDRELLLEAGELEE